MCTGSQGESKSVTKYFIVFYDTQALIISQTLAELLMEQTDNSWSGRMSVTKE